ncbi:MAG TPA: kelch repeat-containing protein [Kofleriaceae bacterium]
MPPGGRSPLTDRSFDRPGCMRAWIVLFSIGCHTTAAAAPVARMAQPRASHGASLLDDGTILVTGGFRKAADGASQLYEDSTELFDPRTNRVAPGPRMKHARAGHVTASLADGTVLVAGGWGDRGALRSAELLDPRRGEFIEVGGLADERGGATATRLTDGRVAVIGGGDENRTVATIEIYEPTTQRWRAAGALAVPRSGHTATLLPDGRVLVIGGAMAAHQVVASSELYDPRTEQTIPAGNMAEARYKHGAVLLANGEVLVLGGSDERDWSGKRATTELYDPRTRSFRPGPRLTAPRFKLPRAVLALANGDIAIAGGATTVEVLHDGRSRTLATLDAAYYSTATRLASDELVVIGGYDDRLRSSTAIWRIAR